MCRARSGWTGGAPLPGADLPGGSFEQFLAGFQQEYPFLAPKTAWRMAHAYGTRVERILGGARSLAALGADLGAGLTKPSSTIFGGRSGRRRRTTCFGAGPSSACSCASKSGRRSPRASPSPLWHRMDVLKRQQTVRQQSDTLHFPGHADDVAGRPQINHRQILLDLEP